MGDNFVAPASVRDLCSSDESLGADPVCRGSAAISVRSESVCSEMCEPIGVGSGSEFVFRDDPVGFSPGLECLICSPEDMTHTSGTHASDNLDSAAPSVVGAGLLRSDVPCFDREVLVGVPGSASRSHEYFHDQVDVARLDAGLPCPVLPWPPVSAWREEAVQLHDIIYRSGLPNFLGLRVPMTYDLYL